MSFLCLCLVAGFVNGLYAGEPLAVQSDAPRTNAFTESAALDLLTATLQRDYVKDRGELELSFQTALARALVAG